MWRRGGGRGKEGEKVEGRKERFFFGVFVVRIFSLGFGV